MKINKAPQDPLDIKNSKLKENLMHCQKMSLEVLSIELYLREGVIEMIFIRLQRMLKALKKTCLMKSLIIWLMIKRQEVPFIAKNDRLIKHWLEKIFSKSSNLKLPDMFCEPY